MSTTNLALIIVALVITVANLVAGGHVAEAIARGMKRAGAARLRFVAASLVVGAIVAAVLGVGRASEKPCQATGDAGRGGGANKC